MITALILWSPYLAYAYHNPLAHLVLASIDAGAALLVAYLVHGRYIRHGALQDLLLTYGLVLLAVSGIGLTYVIDILGVISTGAPEAWLLLALRLAGAALIARAALANQRPARQPATRQVWILAPVAVITVVFLALWTAGPSAESIEDQVPVTVQNLFLSQPVPMIMQGLAALGFLVASIAFASQMKRRDNELLRWLAPAFALVGFASVNMVLSPLLFADWIATGDLLRSGGYLLLMIGATREIRQFWSTRARAAVQDDRRRLAREFHDGVVQELVYIRSVSHSIPVDAASASRIIAACDRALDEVRSAIQALGRPSDEPLGAMLNRVARELAARYEVDLEVELDGTVYVEPDQQHALMRITREAVSNAVHHGKARNVRLRLMKDGSHRLLAIHDDGDGFDVAETVSRNAGYGLISMRERARTLPGSFSVEAATGAGSVVTVKW
ncbi:sensor histidine kinase [Homoserinimonas sp. A447]